MPPIRGKRKAKLQESIGPEMDETNKITNFLKETTLYKHEFNKFSKLKISDKKNQNVNTEKHANTEV